MNHPNQNIYFRRCKVDGCINTVAGLNIYCSHHFHLATSEDFKIDTSKLEGAVKQVGLKNKQSMSFRYPKYYKDVSGFSDIDVYGVHKLFNIQDPSGCIQHASKKLLLSGVRTGGKSKFKDIEEARDTLTRWLELHPETESSNV